MCLEALVEVLPRKAPIRAPFLAWLNECQKDTRDGGRVAIRPLFSAIGWAGVEGLEPPTGGFGDRCSAD